MESWHGTTILGVKSGGRTVIAYASQYLYALATFKSDRNGRFDVTLDSDDPLARRGPHAAFAVTSLRNGSPSS